MDGDVLLDTGPLVAIIDRRDRAHAACDHVLRNMQSALITTEAVLTEACYLLRRVHGGPESCLRLVRDYGVVVLPTAPGLLDRVITLITKYADTPMDYADATLVALAEAVGLREVFTLDRKGFTTYRALDRDPFVILPGE